jgi:hypothetical protein
MDCNTSRRGSRLARVPVTFAGAGTPGPVPDTTGCELTARLGDRQGLAAEAVATLLCMPPVTAEDALSPLPAGYRELFERVLRAAEADDRIRAMWLSGSLGRGVADAGSDLDLVLAITPEAFDEFAAAWRDWLARVTPVVLARELLRLPGSWYSLTPDCLRLDVVTEPVGSALAALSARLLVLDKDGSAGGQLTEKTDADGRSGPDPARLLAITEEFLRQQAIFPAAVVARGDWLLGVQGVQAVHVMLYELFVESNQPLPPMGVKQWTAKLTTEQREICGSLPAPVAEPASLTAAMRAAADAFRAAARQALADSGVPWPDELDNAVLRYQEAELGWTTSPAG